jgi:hypothetical protein
MPQFTPVEHDPFSAQYKPVEHDPFADIDDSRAPFGVMSTGEIPKGTLQGRALKGLSAEVMTAPVKAVKEFMDTGSPESSFDVAATLVGGGMLAAEKDAVGIFGGRLMRTADPEKYALAERLEKAGKRPDDILRETGLAKGADREWKQEIDDSLAVLKTTKVSTRGVPLSDIIDHPEFFEAYPDLKRITVSKLDSEAEAAGSKAQATSNGVQMSSKLTPEEFKSVLLHEVQHVVQYKERFALGDNPLNHMSPALIKAKKEFTAMRSDAEKELAELFGTDATGVEYMKDLVRNELVDAAYPIPKKAVKTIEEMFNRYPEVKERVKNIVKSEQLLEEAEDKAWVKYHRAMGETEARNVQKRMDYPKEQRQSILPVLTEDEPRFLQDDARKKVTYKAVNHDPFNEAP